MRRIYRLLLPVMCLFIGTLFAQSDPPDPSQIYRFIHVSDNERAGDVRWIEIWESQDRARGDRQWVMIDNESGLDGITSTCHYALARGGGAPFWMIDGELQVPPDDPNTFFAGLENRRLANNSEVFIENDFDCVEEGTETINGLETNWCTFEGRDAIGLFLIRPPATATGTLWRAVDGGFPVRYTFEAQGTDTRVSHYYEFVPPGDDFAIEPQGDLNMLCFDEDEGLPVPEGSQPINTNLQFAAYESSLTTAELQSHFDLTLLPEWELVNNTTGGGRVYQRMLDDNTQCTLNLRFGSGREDTTTIAANVLTTLIDPDNLPVTDELASPVVVQNFSASVAPITLAGTVSETVTEFEQSYIADGWSQRSELTDIRTESDDPSAHSAFLVFTQDENEHYLTIDAQPGGNAVLRTYSREGICGPIFETPARD